MKRLWVNALSSLGLTFSLASTVVAVPTPQSALLPLARPPVPQAAAGMTAFVDVAVVPMDTERVLRAQTVVVNGDQIIALGPTEKIRVPAGAVRVDGRGKVLIPGLADMHAHLALRHRLGGKHIDFARAKALEEALSRSDRLLLKEQQLFLWLAHGLTTARILDHTSGSLGSDLRGEELLHLRARAAAGDILSPRIYTSGYIAARLSRPDIHAPLQLNEVAEAVTTYKAAGLDFIKVYTFRGSLFDSVAAIARRLDLPLVGHTAVPLERALATYRSIEHLTGYTGLHGSTSALRSPKSMTDLEALVPQIQELATATQRAGVWNCPTLYNALRNGVPSVQLALLQRLTKALQEAGAGLLAGSDRLDFARWYIQPDSVQARILQELTPQQRRLEVMYGFAGATHRELQALVEAGLTPYQALATTTRNVAAYFGTLASTGTITVGKRADLVLLEGNPLDDIRQTEQIAGVMLGGRWLPRTELDRRTAELSTWLDRRCPAAAIEAGQAPCIPELQDP